MKKTLFNVWHFLALLSVWWFGIVYAFETVVLERYHADLWSVPSEFFTAMSWGVIGMAFVSLISLAKWTTDWVVGGPVLPKASGSGPHLVVDNTK